MPYNVRDSNGNYLPTATIQGSSGREIQLRATADYVQWRYDDYEWQNLVALAVLQGEPGINGNDGREVSLRTVGTLLQWKLSGDEWQDLFDLDGYATITIGQTTTLNAGQPATVTNVGTNQAAILNFAIPRGENGVSIYSMPPGGTANQILQKIDGTDYNADWRTISVDITASLLANAWVGDSAPYTQTVNVTGITAAMKPIVDIVLSDIQVTAEAELENWGKVSKITTGAGSITATCFSDKPSVALNITIKVVG